MEKNAVIGVDVGGTKVCIGLVTMSGEIITSCRYPQKKQRISEWTDHLENEIKKMLSAHYTWNPVAIGIGCRGCIDYRRQTIVSSSVFQMENGFDLCKELGRRFQLPAVIDNDVKAAATAELMFDAGKKYRNFVCYNIGTGIAASIISDGVLVRGKNNLSGEIGLDYFGLDKNGRPAGQLEKSASGRGIESETERLAAQHPSCISGQVGNGSCMDILAAWQRGEQLQTRVIMNAFDLLTNSVLNLYHLLAPDAFVFVGGVISNNHFFSGLSNAVRKKAEMLGELFDADLERVNPEISEIGLLGSAAVYIYRQTRG